MNINKEERREILVDFFILFFCNFISSSRSHLLIMTTTITFNLPTDEETKATIDNDIEHPYLLHPPTKRSFKPLPLSLESHPKTRLALSHSTSDVPHIEQGFIDTTDDDIEEKKPKFYSDRRRKQKKLSSRTRRCPSEIRVTLYPDENINVYENLTHSQLEVSEKTFPNELRSSDPSLVDTKVSKETRVEYLRRNLLGRRIHSSFSSSTTLRSLSRRRSTQNLSPRHPPSSTSRSRRHITHLPRNSKWHIVRRRLNDIAMMSESYARMKAIEQDQRWINLRERVRSQVIDIREMSLLRQQDEGLRTKKKMIKSKFDLKTIPIDEVLHVERDGRVFTMRTRDLVLGRLLSDEQIQLDTFAQLDARRHFQVQQKLLRQQEGRTRLKKHIAFSFCLCNLSFIVLMSAAMFIFAMKTILELRSREFR